MKSLEECRKEIDEIDTLIISLYEKRMNIVKSVINYKIDNNIKVEDKNREASMLDKNLNKISNEEYKKYYKYVLEGYLKASKELQVDILKNK